VVDFSGGLHIRLKECEAWEKGHIRHAGVRIRSDWSAVHVDHIRKIRRKSVLRKYLSSPLDKLSGMGQQLKEAQKATTLWQKAEKMGFMGLPKKQRK